MDASALIAAVVDVHVVGRGGDRPLRLRVENDQVGVAAGAMVPFRGYRPKILAGMVAVSATKRFRLICSSTTPWKSRVNRSSTPGSPFGIRVKSPRPSSFWPRRNGQWSVATT